VEISDGEVSVTTSVIVVDAQWHFRTTDLTVRWGQDGPVVFVNGEKKEKKEKKEGEDPRVAAAAPGLRAEPGRIELTDGLLGEAGTVLEVDDDGTVLVTMVDGTTVRAGRDGRVDVAHDGEPFASASVGGPVRALLEETDEPEQDVVRSADGYVSVG